jgi:hypothetical protein
MSGCFWRGPDWHHGWQKSVYDQAEICLSAASHFTS